MMGNATHRRLALVCAAWAVLGTAGCERLVDRQIERALTRTDTEILEAPGLHVVLCGTGSPLPDPDRASACTAVIAGGELVVVDIGPGSWEVLDLANLPTGALSAVLLTHFHSDHIGDLGEAITQSWIAGRQRMLDVYGPPGTSQIVNGFNQAYAADVQYRVAHHGEDYMPSAAAPAIAHDIPLEASPDAAATVFERNGLRVTMLRVTHDPATPAVGYRFDYAGRAVVISGDTAKSANLLAHTRGADMLIHEALRPELISRAAAIADRVGRERLGKMARDTLEYHTSPIEAAEIARDAGVETLVFTHLVPAPPNFLARRMFLEGVAEVFPGTIVLGEDGMRFDLPPAS